MNKGFTLIELLVVIVILSVISLITIPMVLGIVAKIQLLAYEESLRNIFNATNLYIATNEFIAIPSEGISVMDDTINLKNKNFTSGKIIKNEQGQLELQKVSNGIYCGSGTLDNLVIMEGSCDSLDITPPIITIGASASTSNSITIVADAEDLESGINGYQFSVDNGSTWTSKQISNVYTFTDLTNKTEYTFKVKVYNNNLIAATSTELLASTNDILIPIYSIDTTDWTQSAVVTIIYPERQPGYTYEYSLDEGSTWEEVENPAITKDISFNSNGNVIARISDGTNIVSGTTYEVTNIDVIPPVITVNPAEVTIGLNSTYSDTGVIATDNVEGDITSRIITTGSVDISSEGTYILIYNVEDTAGNIASQVTRTVNVLQIEYTFDYTGGVQQIVLNPGEYLFELWGAQGGGWRLNSMTGGFGGYSKGKISLDSITTLYVYVGQEGFISSSQMAFNGGGLSNVGGNGSYYTGGGATDVRLSTGTWNDSSGLRNRIIVAAGGGGLGDTRTSSTGFCGDYNIGSIDSNGGGISGRKGPNSCWSSYYSNGGYGASQVSGGSGGITSGNSGNPGTPGIFGIGGQGGAAGSSSLGGSGGGGGYYGGGGGAGGGFMTGSIGAGGGGSSFISGHAGCNAVNSSGTHTGQPNHFSGYIFTDTEMQSDVREGNGYVKITFIQ